ncbi:MAG: PAC2 family protein [Anaerolineales bacterium]|nr:PAC2 family protein [Anaerolineales bacterium]
MVGNAGMGIKLYKEPQLERPDLICGWPGIGRVGIMAVDYLRQAVAAEELGEIESCDFFEPRKVIIRDGLLKELEFPSSKFYYQRLRKKDVLFFVGEEQPGEGASLYASGDRAYRMASLVLDIAKKFGSQRIYTSGAAITQTHHSLKPRVWAAPNSEDLIDEVRHYENTILMSETEGRHGQGAISGLNGLLLGVAKKRGIKALCLMGEIPYYLQGSPWPYPKASISVLEVLAAILGIDVDPIPLQEMAKKIEESIEGFLASLYEAEAIPYPVRNEIREIIEKTKHVRESPGPVTEEDQKRIMEHIDEFFKRGGKGDDRAS